MKLDSIDYSKLKGKIAEKCGTQGEFAKRMGWSERTASFKLSGKVSWNQIDIYKAVAVLGISEDDLITYFFSPRSSKH